MATHSSILAWRIPRTEELCRLQSIGLSRVTHDWVTSLSLTYDVEDLFIYLFAIYSFFLKVLDLLPVFKVRLFVFLLLSFENYLYPLDTSS